MTQDPAQHRAADAGLSVARQLAALACAAKMAHLPVRTIDNAKMLVASTVASAALGTQVETARITRQIVSERWGLKQASPWFERGVGASLPDTVRLNAMRSSAAASDDSDLRNVLHAGTAVTTAALACAERAGRRGADVVLAIAVGYEAAARIGEAVTPGFRQAGFHGCIATIFGSAVASGLMLGLSVEHMTHAIALAASTMSGLLRSADESNSREHQDTMAATLGVEVALAAAHGFTGDEWALDGAQGYFEIFGQIPAEAGRSVVCDDFGSAWALEHSMAIKLIPGGHPFHSTAEAALQAFTELGVAPEDVISIRIAAPGLTSVQGPRHPRNLLEMAHSQAYFAAAPVVDGAFSWIHASQEKIVDPEIHRMIDRVSVDPTRYPHPEAYRLGATVTVLARNGESARVTVYEPRGSGRLGIAWSDVDAKYRALAPMSGMSSASIEASLDLIHRLDELDDLRPLLRHLTLETP